jgi:hypothetical protein
MKALSFRPERLILPNVKLYIVVTVPMTGQVAPTSCCHICVLLVVEAQGMVNPITDTETNDPDTEHDLTPILVPIGLLNDR